MGMTSGPHTRALYLGTFIHSISLNELEYLHNFAVCVDENGIISRVTELKGECKDTEDGTLHILNDLGWDHKKVVVHKAPEGGFFFPGFIGILIYRKIQRPLLIRTDTHIHASQYPNAGIFGKTTLMDWLNKYTFPMESSLQDIAQAKIVYEKVIQRTLSHGTTTAAYYATISVPSTNLLADLCLEYGQRAFIGRVCMDSLSPDDYRDVSAESSLQDTCATIAHIKGIDPSNSLITPILTPRFAPSCSSKLMHGLAALQKETNLPIQTHISENYNEMALVKSLFPDHDHYTHVYDDHGLLGPKTVLAHAIHLSEDEAELIKKREAKISHCPASNSALTSGTAKVRWLLEKGIDVGLGTDMSGGYSPSILEAARQASLVSRHVAMGGEEKAKLSIEEVLYLATRGGANVLGLIPEKTSNSGGLGWFAVGQIWDAQEISLESGPVDIFGWETWEERVAKWVFNGDDRNTRRVWVQGRLVHERKC